MRSRALSLAAGLILLLPVAAAAQVRFGVMGGPGYTTWSGPLVEGGKFGIGLLGVSFEWPMGDRVGIRSEFGVAQDRADLGETGLFDQPTSLTYGRMGVSGVGRYFFAPRTARTRFFAEAGAGYWLRLMCDVDLKDDPGLLGGETVSCENWTPTADVADRPLDPAGSGFNVTLGVGASFGHLGTLLRYEVAGFHRASSTSGAISAHPLMLVFEWAFGRGK